MLCNIRKKKVAVLLMGPNEWLLYWFLFEGLILNDFLISPGLPPLPWFGVRSPCSYSKVFAYAALPPPLVKAGGITDDWKVNGRMKWGGWRVCLTGNLVLGGNERLLLRPPSEWRRERFCLKQIWLKGEEAKVLPNNGCGLYEGFPEWQGKSLSTTGNEEWTMAWISWWLRLKGKGLWLAIALWALSRQLLPFETSCCQRPWISLLLPHLQGPFFWLGADTDSFQ